MEENRLEAFSGGVLAIIITITVLELSRIRSTENGLFLGIAEMTPTVPAYQDTAPNGSQ